MNTIKQRTSILVACSLVLSALPAVFAGTDAAKHFKMMDTDGDGKVSRAEHAAAARQMFTQCDANHDGIVTVAEMDASSTARGEKPGKDDKTSAEKIQMLDQNQDGKLSLTEHETGTERLFGKMDTNSDGFLSKEECEAGLELMKKDA